MATELSDDLFSSQWHLQNTGQSGGTAGVDINVLPVWDDYTGKGVTVGVLDEGIDIDHPDLVDAYNTSLDYDSEELDGNADATISSESHGTQVAGVISQGRDNGTGGVGVAYDADVAGIRINYGNLTISALANALNQMQNFDVVNNSWGVNVRFADDFSDPSFSPIAQAVQDAAVSGRGGLGTVVTFAAGNAGDDGDDVNYHNFQNSIYTISVGAIDRTGSVAEFSTPGAANLVSAPGVAVVTTDNVGSAGGVSGDYTSVSGTSFAAPNVAGVAALMLEANSALGYRDVQEILALSARDLGTESDLATNGASMFNGGGFTVSHETAHGLVDAHAAVRLAESWTDQRTTSTLASVSASSSPAATIPDNNSTGVSDSILLAGNYLVEQVEVTLDIDHTFVGDLTVELVSPSGTVSALINRPGKTASDIFGDSGNDIGFTTTSTFHWGEAAAGEWTLRVTDSARFDFGTLNSWSITVHGRTETANDLYAFTDGYAELAQTEGGRTTLADSDGGTDVLNAAAVTTNSTISLEAGTSSQIDGTTLGIAAGTSIENAYGGGGNDSITGSTADNLLDGGRGNDVFTETAGADTVAGGTGSDTLILTGARADYSVSRDGNDLLLTGSGTIRAQAIEFFQFSDGTLSADAVETNPTPDPTPDDAFVAADYLAANPDLPSDIDALTHFVSFGYIEGRLRSFDATAYLSANPDVASAGVDALTHYIDHGRVEGRLLSFDAASYLVVNPDLAAAGETEATALTHYQLFGQTEQRLTSFDSAAYFLANPDVETAGDDALAHYLANGRNEGRGFFDSDGYIVLNPDSVGAGVSPTSVFSSAGGGDFALMGTTLNDRLVAKNDTPIINGGQGDDEIVLSLDGTRAIGGDGADTFAFQDPIAGSLTGTVTLEDAAAAEGDRITFDSSLGTVQGAGITMTDGSEAVVVSGTSVQLTLLGINEAEFQALYVNPFA